MLLMNYTVLFAIKVLLWIQVSYIILIISSFCVLKFNDRLPCKPHTETGVHQYHIQIVPTRYQDVKGKSSGSVSKGIKVKPGRRIHSQYSMYERLIKVI